MIKYTLSFPKHTIAKAKLSNTPKFNKIIISKTHQSEGEIIKYAKIQQNYHFQNTPNHFYLN